MDVLDDLASHGVFVQAGRHREGKAKGDGLGYACSSILDTASCDGAEHNVAIGLAMECAEVEVFCANDLRC